MLSNKIFGELTIGKVTTPYKAAGKNNDYFWDTPTGTTFAGNNFVFSDMTRGFTEHAVLYTSPMLGNFKVDAGYSGENSNGDYHVGAEYQESNSVYGVQYIDLGDDAYVANHNGSKDAIRLYTWQLVAV